MQLFRKIESEKRRSSTAAGVEVEKWIEKVVFLLFIVGVTLIVPLSVDISLSVQNISQPSPLAEQVSGMFVISFLGMIFGVVLFTFYDRHYFSKSVKTSVVHSTIFALGIAVLSIVSVYSTYSFEEAALAVAAFHANSVTWVFGALRTVCFLGSAPAVTYALDKILIRR